MCCFSPAEWCVYWIAVRNKQRWSAGIVTPTTLWLAVAVPAPLLPLIFLTGPCWVATSKSHVSHCVLPEPKWSSGVFASCFRCRVLVSSFVWSFVSLAGQTREGFGGGEGQGVPRGLLGEDSGALSKNVSCEPRASQRGPVGLWGHGHQWSEKPSISMSLRAGCKLVQHDLFMRCIYGSTH